MKQLKQELKWTEQYYCDDEFYDLLNAIHKKQLNLGVNESVNKIVNETLLDNKRNEINIETAELTNWYYDAEEDIYGFVIEDEDYTMYHFLDQTQVGVSHQDHISVSILVNMNTKQTALFCVYGWSDNDVE